MKKVVSLVLVALMAVAVLAGCGSDPLYDDLSNYLNVEMVEVNANYENLKAELAKWESFEDDAALATNISDVILPIVNDSLKKLEAINPATEEVKAVKAKYVSMMEEYKKGFEALLEGCNTQEDEIIATAYASIEKAVSLLDEYNKALEELAAKCGTEVEY